MGQGPNQKRNAARDEIWDAAPHHFLIGAMNGEPLPVKNADGEIVSYERISAEARVAAAERLLSRILPTLQSAKIEATEGGTVFKIVSPFELPGSRRGKPDEVDGTIDYAQLEKLRDVIPTKTEDDQ